MKSVSRLTFSERLLTGGPLARAAAVAVAVVVFALLWWGGR